MIKIKKLKVENLGRFVGIHEINFESKSNFIQIDAKNENTGGSSGSGKSSVFLALEYVLGLNDVPATVLQSRLTKNPMSVEVVITKDDQDFTIIRNKASGLSIFGPNTAISGNTKEAEDVLDRVLSLSKVLIRPMLHKRQGEGGFFLSKTPKQSYEFLMECLGMSAIEEKVNKIELELKKNEESLTIKQNELNSIVSSVAVTDDILSSIKPPVSEINESVLTEIWDKLQKVKKQKNEISMEMEKKTSRIKDMPPFDHKDDQNLLNLIEEREVELDYLLTDSVKISNKISEIVTAIKVDGNHVQIFKSAIENKSSILSELESIKFQITEAMRRTCPTCRQQLQNETVGNEIIAPLVEKASRKRNELQGLLSMEEKLPIVLNTIKLNEQILIDLKKEDQEITQTIFTIKNDLQKYIRQKEEARNLAISNYRAMVSLISKEKQTISSEYLPTLEKLELQIDAYNHAYYQGQADLKSYKESVKRYSDQKRMSESKLESLKEESKNLESQVQDIKKKLTIALASLKFLKSYANQLFQESLAMVATTATKILSRIPNMATATVTFDAYKETKAGSLKEEVVAILSIDDEVNVPVRSMSGGERASVDLAVDLAVIDMIEKQTGSGLDLFILDEPFDGLDEICRENCIEVLKNQVSDRKIVIVDHSSETKQMVQDKILIIRNGQISKINDNL